MIAWKYINKHSATITAIQDYSNMMYIIENTNDDVKEAYESITKPKVASFSVVSATGGIGGNEEQIAKTLDKIDVMKERYATALEFMSWFDPAWQNLSDRERLVLKEFYMGETLRSGATYRLREALGYSERHIERLRHKALSTLTVMLYGK